MSIKQLTDEELTKILTESQQKKGNTEFSEVSLCVPGDKIFFEPATFTEEDWYQKENKKLPYYIGKVVDMSKANEGKVVIKATEPCSFLGENENAEYQITKLSAFSDEAEKGIPDMVDLDKLNNATLLHNLKQRYYTQPKEIYTYVTPSLLVLNPYCRVPHLMTPEILSNCRLYVENDKMTLKDIVPHTYSIAARAMKQMFMNKERQAIVISGESGAGKTEAAKIAMSFLAGSNSGKAKEDGKKGIEERIIACNPVLEAFGNAKTPRNYNSSRFGKYVKILFNIRTKEILGAITKPYLLEKSRIVKITDLDRNYHIFYHLMKGGSLELLKSLFLLDAKGERMTKDNFFYLKYGCDNIDKKYIDDIECYELLLKKVSCELNFSPDEVHTIWKIVAAVLYLGNVELDANTYDMSKNSPCKVKDRQALETAAKLLGGKPDDLEYEITYKGKVGDAKRAVCNAVEAFNQRDTFAKTLYNNLFSWLVVRMNTQILDDITLLDSKNPDIKTIGLLDIFGFECFLINDYEQLLINYTNEKLQKLYLNAVFEAEKITFKEEGLADLIGKLTYTDRTTPVIELLDNKASGKPQGIFNKIDDYKKNEDAKNLKASIAKDFEKHDNYMKHKDAEKFQLRHTAKIVVYSSKEFIEKNLDKMSDDLKEMMYKRIDPLISSILKSEEGANVGNTIWKKFSVQMRDLMDELAESSITGKKTDKSEPCELHFIRCIKPNEVTNNNLFVSSLVLMQITYMGVLDTIRVRKVNYPNRVKYNRFYERYEDLCSESLSTPLKILVTKNPDFSALSKQLMKEQFGELGKDRYVFGTTKIFMRNEIISALEEARARAQSRKNEAVTYIYDCFHAYEARKKQIPRIKAAIKTQKDYRRRRQKRITFKALKMILKIENSFLTYKTEKRKAIEEKACKSITSAARTVSIKNIVAKGIKARKKILTGLMKAHCHLKIHHAIKMTNIVLYTFRKSWAMITRKMLGQASSVLVRVAKGHLQRKAFSVQIAQAKDKA